MKITKEITVSVSLCVITITLWILYGLGKINIIIPIAGNILQLTDLIVYKNIPKKRPSLKTKFSTAKFKLIPSVIKKKLLWKDKHGTPRCQRIPYIRIKWLWFRIFIYRGGEQEWEQWLWIHKYNNGDVESAKETWPWIHHKTKKSTWKQF